MKNRTNLFNFSCRESLENIGAGRQKSDTKTHLPPVSTFRGATFVGQMLAQFVTPSFLLPKEEQMDSAVKRMVMVTWVEGNPSI